MFVSYIFEVMKNMVFQISEQQEIRRGDADMEYARSCPNTLHLFPESVRRPLRNLVDGVCPRRPTHRKLYASEFQVCKHSMFSEVTV
jgi:mannosidase alpha-like ER degradation enhancer 3